MLIFQLPHRRVQIEKNLAELSPPYQVELAVKLGPEEFFGDAPLTGRLRQLFGGQQVQMPDPDFHGLKKPSPIPYESAKKFSYNGTFSGVPISFNGGTATLMFVVADINFLGDFVQEVTERLAASFAPACVVPVEIMSMGGTVNRVPFKVLLPVSRWHPSVAAIGAIARELDLALPVVRQIPRQIIAAQRYLAQNYRLDYLVDYASQVTGERLLNLCKSFESLIPSAVFSGDPMKQDERIREFLAKWSVHKRYADVLISLRKLRSSLDVAHIRRAPMSSEAHESIEGFLPLAESCVQALITTAIKNFMDDPSIYPEEMNVVEDIAALRFVRGYADLRFPQNGDLQRIPDA